MTDPDSSSMGVFGMSDSPSSEGGITALPSCLPSSRTPTRNGSRASTTSSRREKIFETPPGSSRRFRFGSRDGSGASTPVSTVVSPVHGKELVSPIIPPRTSSRHAGIDESIESWATHDILARHLLATGRRLRSPSSKRSISSIKTDSSMIDSQRNNLQRSRSLANGDSKSKTPTSPPISTPSDFRHMAHIRPEEYQKLAFTDEDNLAASFSAMRASQNVRRDLRGIKTVDIHSRTSSVETTTTSPTISDATSSSQISPDTSCASSSRTSVQSMGGTPVLKKPQSHSRVHRSQDSFSQPFLYVKTGNPIAPPRMSSKAATYRNDATSPHMKSSARAHFSSRSIDDSNDDTGLIRVQSSTSPLAPMAEREDERHIPQSPKQPLDTDQAWPLPPSGPLLPLVEEYERPITATKRRQSFNKPPTKPPTSPLPPVPYKPSHDRQIDRVLSSGSSSEESSTTVTPTSHLEARKMGRASETKPPPSFNRYQSIGDRTSSMKRSSINQGLFTGWAVDDGEEEAPGLESDLTRPLNGAKASDATVTSGHDCAKDERDFQYSRSTNGGHLSSRSDSKRSSQETKEGPHISKRKSSINSKSPNHGTTRPNHSHASSTSQVDKQRIRPSYSSSLPVAVKDRRLHKKHGSVV